MRVGDKDGLNVIYNENGELILSEDEEILVKEENLVPSLKTTWRKFGGEDLIDSANGTAYLTNLRFVFITQPESVTRIGVSTGQEEGPKSYAVQMGPVGKPKAVSPFKGIRDYIELLVKELLACEVKAGLVSQGEQINVFVMAAGKQYHLTFLAKENSELLKRFKKKTVGSSEELVQNLKKHFENTDWVYGG